MTLRISGAIAPRRNDRESGFTLIELLLVVSLMVTLTAVALPRFSTTTRARGVQLGGELAAECIRFARYESVRSGLTVRVLFEDEGARIRLTVQDPLSLGRMELAEGADSFFDEGIRLPAGMRVARIEREGDREDAQQIEFRPDGTGDPLDIVLESEGEEAGRVVLGVLYDAVQFEVKSP